jgi:tetratricopeptide (TPR) repeat protein
MSETPGSPTDVDTELAARLLRDASDLSNIWRLRGRWDDALVLLRGVLPVAGDQSDAALSRICLALARVLTDEGLFGGYDTLAEREALLDEAQARADRAGEPLLLGDVLDARGLSLHAEFLESVDRQEPAHELELFERGMALRRQGGGPRAIAESLFHVGLVHGVVRRDHARALPYFEEAYRTAQAAGDLVVASYAIRHIAFAHHHAGKDDVARAALVESLELRERAGFIPGVAMALVALAYADTDHGDIDQAMAHLDRAKQIFLSLGTASRGPWVEQIAEELRQQHAERKG